MKRLVLCYKDFSSECHVSHKGLGNSMAGTCQVLRQKGYRVEIWPIKGGDHLLALLDQEQKSRYPVSHVVIAALFIPSQWMARLAMRFTEIQFAVNCHSNTGFLQSESEAITKERDVSELYTTFHNLHAAANSLLCEEAFQEAYGTPLLHLPNLYNLKPHTSSHRPRWQGGTLRIAAFGSGRALKNFTNAAFAAVAMSRQLKAQTEFWMNSERTDGNGDIVERAVKAATRNVPHLTLKYLPWASPAYFKEVLSSMHVLLQPSYTESFNLTTADAISMGVPAVVGPAIHWVPDHWKVNVDSVSQIAGMGRALVFDPHAPTEGFEALARYNAQALRYWVEFLELGRISQS